MSIGQSQQDANLLIYFSPIRKNFSIFSFYNLHGNYLKNRPKQPKLGSQNPKPKRFE
jgi:hypothetical protein